MIYDIFRTNGLILGDPLQWLFFKRKTYYNGDEVNAVSGNSPIFKFVITK